MNPRNCFSVVTSILYGASYILTAKGREMLEKEYGRICAQALDYCHFFEKEGRNEGEKAAHLEQMARPW